MLRLTKVGGFITRWTTIEDIISYFYLYCTKSEERIKIFSDELLLAEVMVALEPFTDLFYVVL